MVMITLCGLESSFIYIILFDLCSALLAHFADEKAKAQRVC